MVDFKDSAGVFVSFKKLAHRAGYTGFQLLEHLRIGLASVSAARSFAWGQGNGKRGEKRSDAENNFKPVLCSIPKFPDPFVERPARSCRRRKNGCSRDPRSRNPEERCFLHGTRSRAGVASSRNSATSREGFFETRQVGCSGLTSSST